MATAARGDLPVVSRALTSFGKHTTRFAKQGVVRPEANIETCARLHICARQDAGIRNRIG